MEYSKRDSEAVNALTLRDQFAMAALEAVLRLAHEQGRSLGNGSAAEVSVRRAYEISDAMLQARQPKPVTVEDLERALKHAAQDYADVLEHGVTRDELRAAADTDRDPTPRGPWLCPSCGESYNEQPSVHFCGKP